ncbi:MAG: efflux RND transporter permease subunit [Hyphomicrobiales bacterium]|nr:efflux RND transporter permease subunit [Hyphomicrobiales bacterium]
MAGHHRHRSQGSVGNWSLNFSRPFIHRPIGTTLLAIGLFLAGLVAFRFLPVASLPTIELPTIRVAASRPGTDPVTMAATVAAPLERRLGEIAGLTEITSVNGVGTTRISLQFDMSRSVDGAARDVQAAINAAISDLPFDMPVMPSFRKANPNAIPVIILALTSRTMPASAIYDAADTVIAQRLSQVEGVAEVNVSGAEQPAIRVRINPLQLANMGISMEEVRQAINGANIVAPLGAIDGPNQLIALDTNAQLRTVDDYRGIVVKNLGGTVVRLGDVAAVEQGTRNSRSAALFNLQPAVLLFITKQGDANVIDTVDRVKALIPELKRWIPAGIEISVLSDRTQTIRASIADMEFTLALAVALVMLVVALFLRRTSPTVAAGVTVPLSLAGTLALMWVAGFSINNLTLMALAISVGFVVDDAIVMIENMIRNLDRGMKPMQAALEGARQIGFTVVAISVSLVAAFIPLLFMPGIIGRFLREFSLTMTFAIVVSTIVSLSVTPMICAHFVKPQDATRPGRFARLGRPIEWMLQALQRGYASSLDTALRLRWLTTLIMLATIAVTVHLYIKIPKGMFPQDDTGLVSVSMEASPDVSFEVMNELQRRAVQIVLADPAVSGVGSSVGASFFSVTPNTGRMFVALKPVAERGGLTSQQVVDRLRRPLNSIPNLRVFLFAVQDFGMGARQSKSKYQLTVWGPEFEEVSAWAPRVLERVRSVKGTEDVTTDREQGGLSLDVSIDRQAIARLGVRVSDVNAALNNAFSQRQVSIVYTQRNQYRVILEVDPRFQRDPSDLSRIFVPARGGAQVPLTSVIRTERGLAALVVNHQGPFPAITISYNLADGAVLDTVQEEIRRAVAELRPPDTLRIEDAGDARLARSQAGAQPLLILAALVAVYIVLGVLYESVAHPLTIISTLPSAGLGALTALLLVGMEFSMVAFIGVILLIGIVKKNGIMLVDFALDAERNRGLSARDAIREACLERFRPILMTTLAALLGAIPLAIAAGPGSEMRRPLGITIIGGLAVSQLLTLYTTPVIYLALDRLHRRWSGRRDAPAAAAVPAE